MKFTKIAIVLFILAVCSNFTFAQDCCNDGSCCSKEKTCCSNNSAAGLKDSTKDNVAIKTVTSDGPALQSVDPVTGETVGEGSGVKFDYLGTTYSFASDASLAKFKAEPFDYVKDLKCPVMGDDASKENGVVVKGTKYYLCCSMCEKAFKKDPDKYIGKKEKTK